MKLLPFYHRLALGACRYLLLKHVSRLAFGDEFSGLCDTLQTFRHQA